MFRKKVFFLLFIAGVLLIGINISGFFLPHRSPDVYQINKETTMGITQTYQQTMDIVDNISDNRKQYLINVNHAVNQGVAHYWGTKNCTVNGTETSCIDYEGIDKYYLRVPIYENYILFSMSYVLPDNFLRYEFTDYKRALDRGVGFCDQQTIILDGILKSQKIESYMVDTPHHFFETALADPAVNEWWVLDPDYGVVIPYSLQQIRENPELVRTSYLKEGYSNDTIDMLISTVYENQTFILHPDISEYSTKLYPFEQLSYILIWVIPLCFMLPFTIDILQKVRREYKK